LLTNITIKNYALIDEISIDFSSGLSTITGETGAGKSILLGALGLVLGNRADIQSLRENDKKCVIEATLDISKYNLNYQFDELDLDYEDLTVLRREILPSGKSRAFVNDTPVALASLNNLRNSLIDIHSQNQTAELSSLSFQYSLIDSLANNDSLVASYKRGLRKYKSLDKDIKDLILKQEEEKKQYDYNLHLFNELKEADLKSNEQNEIESELDKLNNVEIIKSSLSEAQQMAADENLGAQSLLTNLTATLSKINIFSKDYQEIYERFNSLKIELDDLVFEVEKANDSVEYNPVELERLNDRLQLILDLQKKHLVSSIDELLDVYQNLSLKIDQVESASEVVNTKRSQLMEVTVKLDELSTRISINRKKVVPKLTQSLSDMLAPLGMPNAEFKIEINTTNHYFTNGKDELTFLFSANKGGSFGELKKVASGGEMSRIMLVVKSILSKSTNLPTIIFDEIDTGVSGEISTKMANIMDDMSKYMQVISITHLPQIASKGKHHYKVYKEDINEVTISKLKKLVPHEREIEIAEMLGGKNISKSALTHARELLN